MTCAITGVLALRNRKQNGETNVEYDDEYDAYEEYEEQGSRDVTDTNVDQSDSFTVVSLDDTDYKDLLAYALCVYAF